MVTPDNTHMKFYELRRQAEQFLRKNRKGFPKNLVVDIPRLIQELEVHQIELEMQNHELRKAQKELEESRTRYFDLYDLAPVGYFTVSEKGLILEANLTAANFLGMERAALVKEPLTRFILPEDQDVYYLYRKRLFETGGSRACEIRMLRRGDSPCWMRLEMTLARNGESEDPISRAVISDVHERKQAAEEREVLIGRLQEALDKVKTLTGLLPICASCKKLRDDVGYWHQVEEYVQEHTQARFSHALCPDCLKKLYPEYYPAT